MTKDEGILVFGAGGHAHVILDLLAELKIPVAGIVNQGGVPTEKIANILHYVSDDNWTSLPQRRGIVAIGDNNIRAKVVAKIQGQAPDFEFLTLIHPRAIVSRSARICLGSVVMAGVVVNAGSQVGEHCILNTSCSVDHDCNIQNFASINPGAVLVGNVDVGSRSAIGLGASVIHGIQIGYDTVIGAGAVVVKNIEQSVLAYGNPCEVVRSRTRDESYL